MASHDATIQHVVIQAIGRIGELEALLEKTDSDSERRSLQAAIAELRQVIRDHIS